MRWRVIILVCALLVGCGTQPLQQPDLSKTGSIPPDAALEVMRHVTGSHPFTNRRACRFDPTMVTSVPSGTRWRYTDLHLWGQDNGAGWWLLLADTHPRRTSGGMSDLLEGKQPGCFVGAIAFRDPVAGQAAFDRAVTAWVSLGGRLKADD